MTLRPVPFDRSFRGSYSRFRDNNVEFIFSNKLGIMRKELLTGGSNTVGVVLKKGGDVTFRIGLTIIAYFAHMCRCLVSSAVSSHVLVSLLILGSV
jgi:hypothetical protein